jgi:hypothetical protein
VPRIAALVLALLIAGCSSPEEEKDAADDVMTPPIDTARASEAAPDPVDVSLAWEGTLVAGAWACEFMVIQDCQWHPDGAFGQSHDFDGLTGNVTAGTLRLEWIATTPLTQELVLDSTIYTPGCADCNHTMLGSLAGPSPLVLVLDGVRFAPGEILGIGIYSNQYRSFEQGAAGTSGDQDFAVSGIVTLLP